MHKIDGAGNINGQFVSEDAAAGRPPTLVTPEWLNAVQGELVALVEAAGLTLDKANPAQVLQAIQLRKSLCTVFTASGSFTVPAGVYRLHVRLVGGGGAGGGSTGTSFGSGGGAGGYVEGWVSVAPGQVIPVTVGSAGQGVLGANGDGGGTSSFGTFGHATGGSGGVTSSVTAPTNPAAGGFGGGGFWYSAPCFTCGGGSGQDCYPDTASGIGGSSAFGGGGRSSLASGPDADAHAYGAGGGASYGTVSSRGGHGGQGLVIVEY